MSRWYSTQVRLLLFSPFSGIWPHSLLESQLINLLDQVEIEVTVINCDSSFPVSCTVRESMGLNAHSSIREKSQGCENCKNNVQILKTSNRFPTRNLSEFIYPADKIVIDNELEGLKKSEPQHFIFNGINVGELALYELLLIFKKRTLELNDEQFDFYKVAVQNCLITIIAAERILEVTNPDLVLCHSPQYAVPGSFAARAIQLGKKVYSLGGTTALSEVSKTVRIWDWQRYGGMNPALERWADREWLISTEDEKRIQEHAKLVRTGTSAWTYSAGAHGLSTHETFEVPHSNKILLAVMNSQDEYFAAVTSGMLPKENFKGLVFADQISWLRELIHFVKKRDDLCLIIRPHPREFPNKRESVIAESIEVWEALLTNLPENVRVDHPRDRYSFMDHLDEIDVLTTGWSSTAIDALWRGIPVVTYDYKLPMYPAEIHLTGNSYEEYFRNIEKALSMGRSQALAKDAQSWFAFSNFEGAVMLGGGLFDRPIMKFVGRWVFFRRVVNRLFPNLIKRLEVRLPVIKKDQAKLRRLFAQKNDSLFD
jgi:hypothetical protein